MTPELKILLEEATPALIVAGITLLFLLAMWVCRPKEEVEEKQTDYDPDGRIKRHKHGYLRGRDAENQYIGIEIDYPGRKK